MAKKDERIDVFHIDVVRKSAIRGKGKHADDPKLRHPESEYDVKGIEKEGDELVIRLKKVDMKKKKAFLEKIAKKLAPSVKVKELLLDTLGELHNEDLKEIEERLFSKNKKKQEKKTTIRSKEGCYKLHIGGKKGKPFELFLRD